VIALSAGFLLRLVCDYRSLLALNKVLQTGPVYPGSLSTAETIGRNAYRIHHWVKLRPIRIINIMQKRVLPASIRFYVLSGVKWKTWVNLLLITGSW
jgi:hypothetical protein